MKAAAVHSVPPPSAVTLVSVVARRALVPAALRGNARRGAALVASAAPDGQMRRSPGPVVAKLTDVMSRPVQVATPGQRLSEVDDAFFAARQYSGLLPVVDDDGRCVGVISNKDKAKAPNGMESTVAEVMTSPAITLTLYKTVLEAAALMLKEKVHRIPVVNEQQHVIGIVTRSDVFQALEATNKAWE